MTSDPVRARSALLCGLLALLVVSAGCSALGQQGPPSGDAVERQLSSLHAVNATVVTTMGDGEGTNRSVLRATERVDGNQVRAEVLEPESQRGTLIVSNGSVMQLYNRSSGQVRVVQFESLDYRQTNTTTTITRIFRRLDGDGGSTPVSVSSLPVVPGPTGGAAPTGTASLPMYGNVTVNYRGRRTVNGRDAYVVGIRPRDNDSVLSNYTVWFDAEWYFPLRTRTRVNVTGESRTITSEYRNVTFNPDVPEGTFEFEPPANATVVNVSTSVDSYNSRAALVTATDRPVPDPDVPPDYRFQQGRRIVGSSGESLSIEYTNGSASLLVSVSPTSGTTPSGEPVSVDGRTVNVTTFGESRLASFRCGNTTYSVIGSEPREVLVDVAASIRCERAPDRE